MWVTLKSLVFDVKFFTVGFSCQVYAVCTSVKELCTRIPRMTGEEKEYETIERGLNAWKNIFNTSTIVF